MDIGIKSLEEVVIMIGSSNNFLPTVSHEYFPVIAERVYGVKYLGRLELYSRRIHYGCIGTIERMEECYRINGISISLRYELSSPRRVLEDHPADVYRPVHTVCNFDVSSVSIPIWTVLVTYRELVGHQMIVSGCNFIRLSKKAQNYLCGLVTSGYFAERSTSPPLVPVSPPLPPLVDYDPSVDYDMDVEDFHTIDPPLDQQLDPPLFPFDSLHPSPRAVFAIDFPPPSATSLPPA